MAIDVLGLGAVALDEIIFIDEYPAADAKVRASHFETHCGGLTGNALITAARMGAKCAYAGRLGRSADAEIIEQAFAREGIDTRHASHRAEDGVVKSVIVVGTATGTRNVFSRRTGLTGAQESEPPEDVVKSARVLFLDHHGGEGGVRAAKIADNAGIPIVGDFERLDAPCLDELLALTGHLIVPKSFALAKTGVDSPAEAARVLAATGREVTVVTAGREGCWHVEVGGEPIHFAAFEVEAVDTMGCGDVFHGVYAATLAAGAPLPARLEMASAAAALKASRRGGIPTRAEVDAFLAARTRPGGG